MCLKHVVLRHYWNTWLGFGCYEFNAALYSCEISRPLNSCCWFLLQSTGFASKLMIFFI